MANAKINNLFNNRQTPDLLTIFTERLVRMRFLECCCTSFEEAAEAEKGGAKRVELCSELGIGGVTPPMEMVKQTIEGCKQLAVNVLIRPRGGDFVYSENEIQQMIASIKDVRPWESML